MLDKFFLKYERGGGDQIDSPPEKLPSKSPALLGLMDKVIKSKRGLEQVTSHSSGYKASSEKFFY